MSRPLRSLALVLSLTFPTFGATDQASSSVHVVIRPAMSARLHGNILDLQLRLAPGTQATIWRSEQCSAPSAQAASISSSGTYRFPLEQIEGDGARVCVRSTDGALYADLLTLG